MRMENLLYVEYQIFPSHKIHLLRYTSEFKALLMMMVSIFPTIFILAFHLCVSFLECLLFLVSLDAPLTGL
jgi:hypothetical protein